MAARCLAGISKLNGNMCNWAHSSYSSKCTDFTTLQTWVCSKFKCELITNVIGKATVMLSKIILY